MNGRHNSGVRSGPPAGFVDALAAVKELKAGTYAVVLRLRNGKMTPARTAALTTLRAVHKMLGDVAAILETAIAPQQESKENGSH